jgi:hypothetical protein
MFLTGMCDIGLVKTLTGSNIGYVVLFVLIGFVRRITWGESRTFATGVCTPGELVLPEMMGLSPG